MGITVPTNVAKNLQSTAKKRPYLDVPKDGSLRVRFLPAVEGSDGEIWYHAANHYRLKREDMLTLELNDFINTVREGRTTQVTGEHARDALRLAIEIAKTIAEARIAEKFG